MIALATPRLPLGTPVGEALDTLQRFGVPVIEESGDERCYRVETPLFAIAVYWKQVTVDAVWFDDPTGRESEQGRAEKIQAYLSRYGSLKNWELRLDNGWMRYWFNPSDGAQLVYGVHKDVLRFNRYSEQNA